MITKEEVKILYETSMNTCSQEDFDNLHIEVINYFIQELKKVKEKFGKPDFDRVAENLRLFEFKFMMWDKCSPDEESWLDGEVKEMFWMVGEGVSLETINNSLKEAEALLKVYISRPYKSLYKQEIASKSLRQSFKELFPKLANPVPDNKQKLTRTKITDKLGNNKN